MAANVLQVCDVAHLRSAAARRLSALLLAGLASEARAAATGSHPAGIALLQQSLQLYRLAQWLLHLLKLCLLLRLLGSLSNKRHGGQRRLLQGHDPGIARCHWCATQHLRPAWRELESRNCPALRLLACRVSRALRGLQGLESPVANLTRKQRLALAPRRVRRLAVGAALGGTAWHGAAPLRAARWDPSSRMPLLPAPREQELRVSILHRLLGESGPAVRVHEGCEPHLSPIGVGLCGPQTGTFSACPSTPNPSVARAAARARNASNMPPIELHPEPAGVCWQLARHGKVGMLLCHGDPGAGSSWQQGCATCMLIPARGSLYAGGTISAASVVGVCRWHNFAASCTRPAKCSSPAVLARCNWLFLLAAPACSQPSCAMCRDRHALGHWLRCGLLSSCLFLHRASR